jgi:hypothetical protein
MKFRRTVVAVLLAFLATVGAIEGGLRLVDPLGALRYFGDLRSVYALYQEDKRGFVIAPGAHAFSNWQATILPDTTRRVPDTRATDCTIALVGDSVTFGLGVSDDATWANLVARELPDVHVINAGVPAYNVWNVAATVERVKADGYLYLLVANDDEPAPNWREAGKPSQTWAIRQYLYVLEFSASDPYTPRPGALDEVRKLTANPAVRVVAFDVPGLSREARATLIPLYTRRISRADPHADAEGNAQIAASILPIVTELAATRCRIM